MGKIRLIIGREYWTRVRKPSFIIMTILGPLLIGGFIALSVYVGASEKKTYDVLVIDEFDYVPIKMTDTKVVRFHQTQTNITDQQFIDGQFDLMIYIHPKVIQNTEIQMFHKGLPSVQVQRYISEQIERSIEVYKLRERDVDPDIFQQVKTYVNLKPIDIEAGEDDSMTVMKAAVGLVFGFIIYLFIFIYGVQVMRGVIEEKTNRIVEVLISSVKPFQLMMGKIIGIALVGVTQFAMWVLLTLVIVLTLSAVFPDIYDPAQAAQMIQVSPEVAQEIAEANLSEAKSVNGMRELLFGKINWPAMLGMFMFYFLGGYLLYASLFAAVGAAVDNETDTQQFIMPISAPLVFAYIIAFMTIANPESTAATWLSMIPFTSPVLMMQKAAMTVPIWQIAVSMTLLIATFIFTTWIAAKIYRTGILMYGKKASYRELWKWLFYRN